MKQVLRRGLGTVIVGDVPDPVVVPHHVLIQPAYSLISTGTETASIHQENLVRLAAERPEQLDKIWEALKVHGPVRTIAEVAAKFSEFSSLGYAGAGVIVEKHNTVTDLEIGDRVAYGGEGTGHSECVLAARNYVARVPETVPLGHACFATLGSIALNAVRTANIGIGDVVAVQGLGLVGQLISQIVQQQGGTVIGIDIKDSRLGLAQQLGAARVLLASANLNEAVSALTGGRGVDCVIVAAASKSAEPCRQALEICRERGRIVVVGAVQISFPWEAMYLKEISLLMARAYGPGCYDASYEKHGRDYPISHVRWTANRNMQEFLRLLEAGRVQVQPLIGHEFALEHATQAYETIMDPTQQSLAVVLRYLAAKPEEAVRRFQPVRRVEVQTPKIRSSELRVALVGAGNLGRWAHLPILQKLPDVRLHAVYSKNGIRGKNYALRFGASYCCSDYEQILNDPAIDVLLIASRNQEHCPQALAGLRAGKHVFLEKPMALTEEECRLLYHAAKESGKHFAVGFNRRFAPLYTEMKRWLTGRVGPAVINCRVNSPGISGSYWMADPAIGGAVVGEACHFVDLLYWLLEAEPINVCAYSLPTGRQDPIGENNLAASFRFSDGSVGNLTYCTVGSKTSGGERVEAFAPGLGIVTENFKRLSIFTKIRRSRSRWFAEKGYGEQLSQFFAAIRSGRPVAVTALDGARATIGCLRMLASARILEPLAINLQTVLN
jgi:predicted dehydrogenase/threonine dehydrogenase-like Zn-dependent dehydrogenase